jgi:hypothetical protein
MFWNTNLSAADLNYHSNYLCAKYKSPWPTLAIPINASPVASQAWVSNSTALLSAPNTFTAPQTFQDVTITGNFGVSNGNPTLGVSNLVATGTMQVNGLQTNQSDIYIQGNGYFQNELTSAGFTNTALTPYRLKMTGIYNNEVSAAASGAVPINADGTAATSFPGNATTSTTATNLAGQTFSNSLGNVTFYSGGAWSSTNLASTTGTSYTNGLLTLWSNNVATFAANSASGNVGIGTTSPASLLHLYSSVVGTPAQMTISAFPAGNGCEMGGAHFRDLYSTLTNQEVASIQAIQNAGADKARLGFFTGNGVTPTESMSINQSGNVGIGTTTPANKLSVNGDVGAVSLTATNGVIIPQKRLTVVGTNCTFDLSTNYSATPYLVLSTNVYMTQPANLVAGQNFMVQVYQDAVGTWALNFDTNYWRFPSGQLLTTTTNANSQNVLSCTEGLYATNVFVVQTLNFK